MNLILLFASIFLISNSSPPRCCAHNKPVAEFDLEWRTLTKQNFTSEIQLHPSILLIVTVPWCGESLSLMRDISRVITENQFPLEDLKLMKLYRNKEKMVADSLGASGDIAIIYYRNSVWYKYRGRLRAVNIISSIVSMSSLPPSDLPLKSLGTHDELKKFIESTDKAVILLESCGWTSRLLNKDSLISSSIEAKTSDSPIFNWGEAQKVAGHKDTLMCDIHSGFYDSPSFGSLNGSISSSNLDDSHISADSPCNSNKFGLFNSFFTKFIHSAREMFLPLEKQRFGFVSDRSFITSLGINESVSWSVMLQFAGCPDCAKTFIEGDHLDKFLPMEAPHVTELEDDDHHAEILLGNIPSLILFVDRSSNLSTVREASKDALKAFREVALSFQVPFPTDQNSDTLHGIESSSVEAQKKAFEHPKLQLSPTSRRIKSTQKMSIMIMDGEKHVSIEKLASDLQGEGSSLQKILDQIIKPAKGTKLSLIAKDAGFHLLSDDFDIKVQESEQTGKENFDYQSLPRLTAGAPAADPEEESVQTLRDTADGVILEKLSKPDASRCSSSECETLTYMYVESPSHSEICQSASITDIIERTKKCLQVDMSDDPSPELKTFEGNFYFSDGGYRLLGSLTGGFKMPSLVIVDPALQTHYVIEDGASFDSFHLVDFVNRFTNKSLSPYQRSGSSDAEPREGRETPLPSHLKLDTHDIGHIPKVSSHVLLDILMNISNPQSRHSGGGWKEDVLVLFSNSWCAFCQRMELVVREVSNSLRDYEKLLKEESKKTKSASNDDQQELALKTPRVYTIDCTLNDCSMIMETTGQAKAYPSLLLFPGDGQDVVTYYGNVEVSGIIKFLADRGSYSSHLVGDKGILWTKLDSDDSKLEVFEGSASLNPQSDIFKKPVEQVEIRLTSNSPKHVAKWNWIQPVLEVVTDPPSSKVTVGSVIVATAKLLEAYPFDQSKILMVKADESIGYHGLILNKHINWNSFLELTQGSEVLTSAPLSLGGPVIEHENPLVALARKHINKNYPEVIPGIYFLDQSATAQKISEIKSGNMPNVSDYWFFLGYSSWGWEQLHNEIADNAWKVSDVLSTPIQWPPMT